MIEITRTKDKVRTNTKTNTLESKQTIISVTVIYENDEKGKAQGLMNDYILQGYHVISDIKNDYKNVFEVKKKFKA